MDPVQVVAINTLYLMGGSFALGSLFTAFLLFVLDFIRDVREM